MSAEETNTDEYRQLLEEYLERRNDSAFDELWGEFDRKVEEALQS